MMEFDAYLGVHDAFNVSHAKLIAVGCSPHATGAQLGVSARSEESGAASSRH